LRYTFVINVTQCNKGARQSGKPTRREHPPAHRAVGGASPSRPNATTSRRGRKEQPTKQQRRKERRENGKAHAEPSPTRGPRFPRRPAPQRGPQSPQQTREGESSKQPRHEPARRGPNNQQMKKQLLSEYSIIASRLLPCMPKPVKIACSGATGTDCPRRQYAFGRPDLTRRSQHGCSTEPCCALAILASFQWSAANCEMHEKSHR